MIRSTWLALFLKLGTNIYEDSFIFGRSSLKWDLQIIKSYISKFKLHMLNLSRLKINNVFEGLLVLNKVQTKVSVQRFTNLVGGWTVLLHVIDYLRLSKLLIARKYFKINWILSVSSVASPETRGCNLNKHRLYRQLNYYGKVIYDLELVRGKNSRWLSGFSLLRKRPTFYLYLFYVLAKLQ